MKTLYESILDDDIIDKADKSAEMFLSIWEPLKKGLREEYNAPRVKHNIKDAIKKYDLLPHDDEWPSIVEQYNTNFGTKCVEEAPIKYELRVTSSLNTRKANRLFYSVVIDGYWRTQDKKNGGIINRGGLKNAVVIPCIMEFRYDPLDIKPRVIQVDATSDNKWIKRLSNIFKQTPKIDDSGCVFVFR